MSDTPPGSAAPQRRLHLALNLDADDLDAVYHALRSIADDLDHDGRETREWTSGGSDSGFHLTLAVTDPEMTAERYYEQLKAWSDARREARRDG